MKIDSGNRTPPSFPDLREPGKPRGAGPTGKVEEASAAQSAASASVPTDAAEPAPPGAAADSPASAALQALRAKLQNLAAGGPADPVEATRAVVESALERSSLAARLDPSRRAELVRAVGEFLDGDPVMKQRIQRVVAQAVKGS
jgi:hypothetical protein